MCIASATGHTRMIVPDLRTGPQSTSFEASILDAKLPSQFHRANLPVDYTGPILGRRHPVMSGSSHVTRPKCFSHGYRPCPIFQYSASNQ